LKEVVVPFFAGSASLDDSPRREQTGSDRHLLPSLFSFPFLSFSLLSFLILLSLPAFLPHKKGKSGFPDFPSVLPFLCYKANHRLTFSSPSLSARSCRWPATAYFFFLF